MAPWTPPTAARWTQATLTPWTRRHDDAMDAAPGEAMDSPTVDGANVAQPPAQAAAAPADTAGAMKEPVAVAKIPVPAAAPGTVAKQTADKPVNLVAGFDPSGPVAPAGRRTADGARRRRRCCSGPPRGYSASSSYPTMWRGRAGVPLRAHQRTSASSRPWVTHTSAGSSSAIVAVSSSQSA